MQSHINDYITDGESPVSYPYLDTKGCLTIGKGFKIDSEDQFARLDLEVIKDGVPAAATEAENAARFARCRRNTRRLAVEKRTGPPVHSTGAQPHTKPSPTSA